MRDDEFTEMSLLASTVGDDKDMPMEPMPMPLERGPIENLYWASEGKTADKEKWAEATQKMAHLSAELEVSLKKNLANSKRIRKMELKVKTLDGKFTKLLETLSKMGRDRVLSGLSHGLYRINNKAVLTGSLNQGFTPSKLEHLFNLGIWNAYSLVEDSRIGSTTRTYIEFLYTRTDYLKFDYLILEAATEAFNKHNSSRIAVPRDFAHGLANIIKQPLYISKVAMPDIMPLEIVRLDTKLKDRLHLELASSVTS